MSYIPALHRRTGYVVPPQVRSAGPTPSALDLARQVFLTELNALAATNPDDAWAEAESIAGAAAQLVRMAGHARQQPA